MEKIRIFYAADLHGDFSSLKAVKDYLKGTNFDITLITGDILDLPFSEKEIEAYLKPRKEGQEVIKNFAEKKKDLVTKIAEQHEITPELIEKTVPPEIFEKIQKNQITLMELYALRDEVEIPLESGIRGAIVGYSKAREKLNELQKNFEEHEKKYIGIAENNMKKSYQEFKQALSGVEFLTLPGNHDGKCLEEILKEESLHKKTKEIKGVKIAGYGSAQGVPNVVPEEVLEPFMYHKVKTENGEGLFSDAGNFMLEQEPHIAVLHETPLTDDGLRIYAANKKPTIILAGHMHEMIRPYKLNDDTRLIMPGKLGKTKAPTKELEELKTFVEIDLVKEGKDKNLKLQLEKVSYKHIKGGKVVPLAEYNYDKKGKLNTATFSEEFDSIPGGF